MPGEIGIALLGTGIGLGLRHGVDWDHIAAITDVTSTQRSKVRALAMGTLYAVGHAAVVIALGLLAIWAGAQLPDWVDRYMETVVGLTLVALGVWVLATMWRTRGRLVLKSRWMLVFDAARAVLRYVHRRGRAHDQRPERAEGAGYGAATSTGIGMIHGIGAETGSQALLLAAAAGATSAAAGSFLLASFAFGLVVSNTLIAIAAITGLVGARARTWVRVSLGLGIAWFSLVVGTIFLVRGGGLLPEFFA